MSMPDQITPDGRNAFKLSFVNDNLSHLLGRVLTVVDASIVGEQNKAIKDLLRREFSNKQSWFCELAWKEVEKLGEGHGPRQEWESGLLPGDPSEKYSFK